MTTQVSFTTDLELKKKALEKAKKEGLTLKTVLLYSMKAFVENKIHFGILTSSEPEVEEIILNNKNIQAKAKKLEKMLEK